MPYVLPQSHFKLPRTKGVHTSEGERRWGLSEESKFSFFFLFSQLATVCPPVFLFFFFFLQRADFLIFRRLHTTNVVLIVFAYSQPTIHTKSTLSWREDCSVLAPQSTIYLFIYFSPLTGQQMKSLFFSTYNENKKKPSPGFGYKIHLLSWKLWQSKCSTLLAAYLYSLHHTHTAHNVVQSQGGSFFYCAQHASFLVIASHKWLKSNDVEGLDCSSIHPHEGEKKKKEKEKKNHNQLSCKMCSAFLAANDFWEARFRRKHYIIITSSDLWIKARQIYGSHRI